MTTLSGKTALVTGGSKGIGRASALALGRAGARTLVQYGGDEAGAAGVRDAIRAGGGEAEIVGADLAAPDGAHRLAADARRLLGERIDVVVANAGIAPIATIADTSTETFDALFAVNVRAPFFLIQQLLPVLPEGASIVVMSSNLAHTTFGTLSAYAATKGAVEAMVRHAARELGGRGIRVNALAPGIIETDLSAFTREAEGRAMTFGLQALQRIGQPDDIADIVTFLASDAARWVTGATLIADAGMSL